MFKNINDRNAKYQNRDSNATYAFRPYLRKIILQIYTYKKI